MTAYRVELMFGLGVELARSDIGSNMNIYLLPFMKTLYANLINFNSESTSYYTIIYFIDGVLYS